MKQITQKELIKLIEEKQENAENAYKTIIRESSNFEQKTLGRERYKAYIDAYQDLICYLNSREIVPEEKIVTTIPKAKQEELGITQEDLKKFIPSSKENRKKLEEEFEDQVIYQPFAEEMKKVDLSKLPITPYNVPNVEPLRNDRFREFKKTRTPMNKVCIDAKEIKGVEFAYYSVLNEYTVSVIAKEGLDCFQTFNDKEVAEAFYNELVEWWKYWKEN